MAKIGLNIKKNMPINNLKNIYIYLIIKIEIYKKTTLKTVLGYWHNNKTVDRKLGKLYKE